METGINDFELAALLAGMVSAAFVLIITACVCSYLDHRTQARIWRDKRDLSRIDML